MASKLPPEAMKKLRRSTHKSKASGLDLQSAHTKLWKLAANPFAVFGEARVTKP
jgi:hypothetical protein